MVFSRTSNNESKDAPIRRQPFARTLPDLLREQASLAPDAVAAFTSSSRITFNSLNERASRLASALRARGVRRGDRIGILLGNSIEWLEIFFGSSMAGAIVVPFSTWSTMAELEFLITDSKISLLFTASRFGDRNFEADLAEIGSAVETIVAGDRSVRRFATVGAFTADAEPITLAPGDGSSAGDDAVVFYTSGSTSQPKGVQLKHFGIVENGFNIGERQGLSPGDRVFLSAPLFWSYGGANALPAAFSHGAALLLAEKFEAGQALDLIESFGCTAIYTLPAMTNAMVRHPAFAPARTRTLRTGLTIGSPQDFRTAVDVLGVPELCNIYGATETYGNCAVTWHHWPAERRAECQGPPLPGQEFRFRDVETGALLDPGETGLVEVRGFVSPGYSGASAALNPQVFTEDGFYRTGDIGRLDPDGAFVFAGRDAEMIKRAGINVSPAEIEDVLLRLFGVAQAAVVGVPDAERGELIVAYVVSEPGASLQPESILAHCRAFVSKYKLPDHIEIVTGLPLTTTGKLQRKELKQAAATLTVAPAKVRAS